MDILSGEKSKKYIRLAVWMLRKKLGKQGKDIHYDMINASNPVMQLLVSIVNRASEEIKHEEYQRNTVRELGELGLWIVGKDTAYRPVLFWIIKQILDHEEEFREALEDYYQDPEEWYVNAWSGTKKATKEARKKGKIPEYAMSEEEEVFTPQIQAKKLKKYK